MKRGPQGQAVRRTTLPEPFMAFVPRPLPPQPPVQWNTGLHDLLEQANRSLGRLDGVAPLLPDPSLIPRAANELGLTPPTVAAALKHLERLDIVQEVTGRRRDRFFVYRAYLAILNEGTE